jgi:oxygen-independent coproporphyrinogen-3 oxidase
MRNPKSEIRNPKPTVRNSDFGSRISHQDFKPKVQAAYVHVPFCAHHCGYCDFAIAVGQDHLIELYLEALTLEIARLEKPQGVQTLFLGGGTPTYLSARQLDRLLTEVCQWLPPEPGHEFSIEANPGTLDAQKVKILADHSVTRVSLGAQTFHPHLLGILERDHSPSDVARAVEQIRTRIDQLSIDLIFGVPGQTAAEWQHDLDSALALAPDHISTYGLTYEKGTPLWKERQRGGIVPLEEEQELALYSQAIDVLEAASFEQYEISSFARPGKRCRHNQVYWANEPYFGFGMGAARYVDGKREVNSRDLRTYIRHILSGESAIFQSEELPPHEHALETMSLNLRRKEGIERSAFREQTGFDVDSLAREAIPQLAEQGLLKSTPDRVALTRAGRYVADAVIEHLLRGQEVDVLGRVF